MIKIKVGILGLANIALRHLIPSIECSDKFEIKGIASRSLKKVKSFSEKTKYKYFGSYDSIIKSEEIDLVYIPLPNSLHFEWIKKSLLNNKHVIVEKSMCTSFDEVKEVVDIARERGLLLFENFQFQFHNQFSIIESLLNDKIIGDIRYINSSFCFPPFKDKNNIRYSKNLGGGAILDAGAYPIKLSQLLLGQDLQIKYSNINYLNEFEVDLWGSGCIENSKNIPFHFNYGFDNFYQNNLEIVGSKGKIFSNRIFTAPPDFEVNIILEKQNELKKIQTSDNHFIKMLDFVYDSINNKDYSNIYESAISQSKILNEFINYDKKNIRY